MFNKKIIIGLIALNTNCYAISSYIGTDNQDVNVTNVTTTTIKDSGGDILNIQANGSIDVNVAASTVSIQATGGKVITADVKGSTTALNIINVGQPDLHSKSIIYTSSNTMVTAGILSLTGKIKSIDLISIQGTCTYTINSGDSIIVRPNTAESFNFDFVMNNATVVNTAQTGNPVCRVRIVGTN